jgi:3-hydroxyacyl-CoA dehydrogenase/3a,7a,12a-trihydroxy-5b-cholest-24-enoyl-CoA hydratase
MAGNMAFAMKLEQVIKAKRPAGAAPAPAAAAPAPAPAAAPAAAASNLKSDALFKEIEAGVAADASLVKKINGVYVFVVTGAGDAKKEWTIDLKNGNGSVAAKKADKADVTITVSDETFIALAEGKANAQQLFMQGKIKLAGNMALAMKLEQVIKAKRPAGGAAPAPAAAAPAAAAPAAAAAAPSSGLQCDDIFPSLSEGIKADPGLLKRVNGIYEFNIVGKGDAKSVWTVDLKNPPGSVFKGPGKTKADCTIIVSDENFINLINGKMNGQQLFMQGKIKFQGNLSLAMKLEQVFKAKANL